MAHVGVCDAVRFDRDWQRVRAMAYRGFDKRFLMDVERAFAIGRRDGLHIAQAYGRLIDVAVAADDILPTVPIRRDDLAHVGVSRRCLVISPTSKSNASVDGFAGNKNLPWRAWPAGSRAGRPVRCGGWWRTP